MYEKIKKWYMMGLWTDSMIWNAVYKNVLTEDEAAEIIGGTNTEV